MLAEGTHAILMLLSRPVKRAVFNSMHVLWELLVCAVQTLKKEYQWTEKLLELNDVLQLDKCQDKPTVPISKLGWIDFVVILLDEL